VRLLLLLIVIAALPGCQEGEPAAQLPGEVRLAALSPAVAVVLRDLGLEEQIVARHGWDMVLDRALPVAGDQAGLDYEVLLRAMPTHVLLEWGARPLPARLEKLATQHGWSIHNYRLLTLADVERAGQDLHERFSGSQEAWTSTNVARQLRRSFAERPELAGAGRILLLYSTRPPGALGPGSAHHQVLEAIGGQPALTTGNPYLTLDAEDVLRMAPDGIILLRPRHIGAPAEPSLPDEVGRELGRLGELEIPAVREGRLARIDHPLGLLPSTSLGEVADEMAEILGRWANERGPAGAR
jgi:ABC-type hemin transport system substrate-binding protein